MFKLKRIYLDQLTYVNCGRITEHQLIVDGRQLHLLWLWLTYFLRRLRRRIAMRFDPNPQLIMLL